MDAPKLKFLDRDGNAFAIIGAAHRSARKAGWSNEQWEKVRADATSGDYSHMLAVLCENFEVC